MKLTTSFIIAFFLYSAGVVFAQDNAFYEDDTPLLYRQESSLGINLHTSGMGVSFRRGTQLTVARKRMIEVDLVGMKHPKEYKTHITKDSPSFVYGKLNYVSLLRTGLGFQHVLFAKGDRSGVEIRFNYSAGLSLAILKPVYLDIIKRSGQYPFEKTRHEPQRYDPNLHQLSDIYGRSSFGYGSNELSFHPGVYAKSGFSFEYGKNDKSIRALEAGAVLDLFPKAIPIMAYVNNNNYYFSLYLAMYFGGKW